MFDVIAREAASRFGLGDKAEPLVQMLSAHITNKDTGGIAGFMSKLNAGGLGDAAKSWISHGEGQDQGEGALPVSSSHIESLLGGQGGLLDSVTSKLGIGGHTASSALGFLLPMVIGKISPAGSVPTSVSRDVVGAAGAATVAASKVVSSAGQAVGSAANSGVQAAAAAGGGLMKWLPWLAAGIAALFLLSYCNKGGDAAKQAANGAKNAAALKAAGFADDRVLMEKAADSTAGSAKSNAEARRVEVTIRK